MKPPLTTVFGILVLLAFLPSARADLAKIENQYRVAYELHVGRKFDKAVADLNEKYVAALNRAMDQAKKRRELEDAVALRDEIQRVKDKAPLPGSDEGIPTSLSKPRGTYREQLAKLIADRNHAAEPIVEKFAATLAALQGELTGAGKLDEALVVKAYREGNQLEKLLGADAIRARDEAHGKTKASENKTEAESGTFRPGKLSPEVLAAMKKVHAGFKGQEGYVAQFGDSITYSMAFWSPMGWDDPSRFLTGDDGLPKKLPDQDWRYYILGTRDKGAECANYSSWRVGQLLTAVGPVLDRLKPMAAIIMIGTNDISEGSVPASYRRDLEDVIDKCLAVHCVPILNTIPPRRDRDEAVAAANTIIRDIARQKQLPLADFHAASLSVRPGKSWDGTIISKDGVHPSGGKTNSYTAENIKISGYALRNWVNFLIFRQLVFGVFEN